MATLKLYNYLSRKKEIFRPVRRGRAGFYSCGPTVYNHAHIGNLRTYVFEDLLRRALERAGLKVTHVVNITDVEDKIIREAQKSNTTIYEFVKPYEKAFFEDIAKLNVKPAHTYPKATEHVKEMVGLISKLLKNGLAYTADGSVYFSISHFKQYGRLSRIRSQKLKSGTRIEADEYTKEHIQDFVLWKAAKEGEPAWDSPFGKGRPGWHIECSAMSMKYLGETFDIHAGGVDLLFPHHENEIAQSEGATRKLFARFFVEGEHLLVNGEKMSKSIGNVLTLRDIEARGIDPIAFRYLMLTSHYRSRLNFTWQSLEAAKNALENARALVRELKASRRPAGKKKYRSLAPLAKEFENNAYNDLDAPRALAVLWRLARDWRKNQEQYDPRDVLKTIFSFDEFLGLRLKDVAAEKIPPAVADLLKKRDELRAAKQWKNADEVREEIRRLGWMVEDSAEGPKVKRI